jgi:dienelactone hydrolase
MIPRDVEVVDVTFHDASGAGVQAWLVSPSPDGPVGDRSHSGVVLWHWLDTEAPDGNRDEFLDEARALAAAGVVSLLPQGRFPWSTQPTGSAADSAEVRAEVARFRAGLDFVAGRRDVDPARLAVVGHDFGAMYAILAAAEDRRVAALALLAPTPRWGDWFLPFWPIAEDRLAYLAAMRELDPVELIGGIAPRPILLQLATRDFYIPLMAGFELRRAAGGDTVELETYDAEHDLHHHDEARADRLAFLARTLGLPPSA